MNPNQESLIDLQFFDHYLWHIDKISDLWIYYITVKPAILVLYNRGLL
jgi:hypothetical protein